MSNGIASRRPTVCRPLWTFCVISPASVIAQARDHQKDMPIPRIHADPVALAALSVTPERAGWHRLIELSRRFQNKRSRAGTIVRCVDVAPVPAAPRIREPGDSIARSNRSLCTAEGAPGGAQAQRPCFTAVLPGTWR